MVCCCVWVKGAALVVVPSGRGPEVVLAGRQSILEYTVRNRSTKAITIIGGDFG